jgi:hypothetical protein
MFRDEIVSENRRNRFGCIGLSSGKPGRVWLAYRLAQMYFCAEARRQMVLNVALSDVAQGGSSQFGCVPERCSSGAKPGMPKARREKRATASSIRLPELACRRLRPHHAPKVRKCNQRKGLNHEHARGETAATAKSVPHSFPNRACSFPTRTAISVVGNRRRRRLSALWLASGVPMGSASGVSAQTVRSLSSESEAQKIGACRPRQAPFSAVL